MCLKNWQPALHVKIYVEYPDLHKNPPAKKKKVKIYCPIIPREFMSFKINLKEPYRKCYPVVCVVMPRWFKRNNGVEAIHQETTSYSGVWLQSLGSIYWDVLSSGFMWMREKLPREKSPQQDSAPVSSILTPICSRTQQWIPVFAHFAWLLSWPRSPGGQVRSDRLSDASRVISERAFCANLCPRTAPRESANRAAAAAWLAHWASVSRVACTPGDVAPGWLVSISPVRRNLCRLCWRDEGSVQTLLTRDKRSDRHLQSMNYQVNLEACAQNSSCSLCRLQVCCWYPKCCWTLVWSVK